MVLGSHNPLGVLTGILLAIASGGAAPASQGSTLPPPPIHWLIAVSALQKIADNPVTTQVLLPANTTIIEHHPVRLPTPWRNNAHILISFASDQRFVSTPAAQLQGASLVGVGYDNEAWSLTPISEQHRAAWYEQRFAARAHTLGLPYWQLGNLPSLDGSRYGGARWAQVIDVQIQHAERNPLRYRQVLTEAVAQIRHWNPQVRILAGLSTNPSGGPVTATMLDHDIRATRSLVWGYWLNIPSPGRSCPRCAPSHPSIAIALFRQMRGERGHDSPDHDSGPLVSLWRHHPRPRIPKATPG